MGPWLTIRGSHVQGGSRVNHPWLPMVQSDDGEEEQNWRAESPFSEAHRGGTVLINVVEESTNLIRFGCPWKLVTIVSKLGYNLFTGRIQPTFIGIIINLLSTMGIPVLPRSFTVCP